MKIIIVDKLYHPYGGTQDFFLDLVTLLRQHGHTVIPFDGYNSIHTETLSSQVKNMTAQKNIFDVFNALYSWKARRTFAKILDEKKPDIVHINNIHHVLSPSILCEAKKRHIPIIYHLHDYKLVCPTSKLFRSGNICTLCRNGNYQELLIHRCALHRNYLLGESFFLYVESVLHHVILDIYKSVDFFVAPSIFLKTIHEKMGFQGHIVHIPHFVFSPLKKFFLKKGAKRKRIVYFGRIVPEKGLMTLLRIASEIDMDIQIIGSGEALPSLKLYSKNHQLHNVSFIDFLPKAYVLQVVQQADISILPSLYPETFGKSIIESFSLAVPVIASNIGGMPEIVNHGKNGFLVTPGDKHALKRTINFFLALSEKRVNIMRKHAYKTWEERYNPVRYYERIMTIYRSFPTA